MSIQETCPKLPLTGSQRNIWFHQLLNVNEPAYNGGNYIKFDGFIDVETLNNAQKNLVNNTETLRLSFGTIDGEPFQVLNSIEPSDLRVWD